ncbi:hypothetical protein EI77_00279 [Prosthecobacter fusiformis]|uniref:Uncharacterized protein n=1 Tax=Prosthecobacter fusiformis TaxID=48464 RepID=A0A4R7SS15_9BACT|nr:hypothetical protein [Prosthecobacter fusiformis]TDU80977.1 hypothetical protein EI77_00279 [Prosthecobacter fusiformis]
MSPTVPSSRAGATFLWVLAAFASFAVLFYLIQVTFATQGAVDPRIPDRLANKEEILKAQSEIIAKMGLNDGSKKAAIFDKTLETLKAKPEGVSPQVVPGSPTQLKLAAAPAPEAAAPAPAPTPEASIPAAAAPEAPAAPAPAAPTAPAAPAPTPAPAN